MLRFLALFHVRLKDAKLSIYDVDVRKSYPFLSYTLGTLYVMLDVGPDSSHIGV
jgi:hypothetical protein